MSQRDLTKVVERFTSGAATSTLDLLIPTGLKFREAVGFSVGGGQYQPVVPGDTAIYVANISPDSATGRSGLLQIGDRIDEINGEGMGKVSHTVFKYAFKANPKELAIKVTRVEGAVRNAPHPPPPPPRPPPTYPLTATTVPTHPHPPPPTTHHHPHPPPPPTASLFYVSP